VVNIVDVESAQLAHPDPGRVQQLQDRHIPGRYGVGLLCGSRTGLLQQRYGVVGTEDVGQRAVRPRACEPGAGVMVGST
jgi:hypothetical protein